MGNGDSKLSQEQIDKCLNNSSYRLNYKNNCCSLLSTKDEQIECTENINNYEKSKRWFNLITHFKDDIIKEYEKSGFTNIEGLNEDNNGIISSHIKEMDNAARAALSATHDSYKTKAAANNTEKASEFAQLKASKAAVKASEAEESAKSAEKKKKITKEFADLAKKSADYADGYAEDIAEDAVQVKYAATQASHSINELVTDISNDAAYGSNIIKFKSASLSPSNSGSATTNSIAQQQSANNIDVINTLLKSVESFIGFKKEGFSSSKITDLLEYLKFKEEVKATSLKQEISKELEQTTYDNTSELLAQKDNILSKLIFDYMINGQTGTNVEKVYEDLNQENNDKLRKIQIKSYYNKAYKEYIFILKVVICLIILLIPIIFFNKYEYIDNNKTLISIVFIIIVGTLFISYRLYLLHMKDDIDFDRINVPYNRETSKVLKNSLINQGKLEPKNSLFKNLGVTCVGDECCDASMVYDNLTNKCILTENFGGYFESLQNKEKKEDLNFIEPYKVEKFTTLKNLDSIKEDLYRKSLIKSSNKRF